MKKIVRKRHQFGRWEYTIFIVAGLAIIALFSMKYIGYDFNYVTPVDTGNGSIIYESGTIHVPVGLDENDLGFDIPYFLIFALVSAFFIWFGTKLWIPSTNNHFYISYAIAVTSTFFLYLPLMFLEMGYKYKGGILVIAILSPVYSIIMIRKALNTNWIQAFFLWFVSSLIPIFMSLILLLVLASGM